MKIYRVSRILLESESEICRKINHNDDHCYCRSNYWKNDDYSSGIWKNRDVQNVHVVENRLDEMQFMGAYRSTFAMCTFSAEDPFSVFPLMFFCGATRRSLHPVRITIMMWDWIEGMSQIGGEFRLF